MATKPPLAACQRFNAEQVVPGWVCEPLKKRLRLEYGAGLTDGERLAGDFPVYGSNGEVGRHDRHLVEGPGILVGRKGSVGAVHYSEGDFWPIDTVYYVRRLCDDSWRYLYYLLDYLKLGRLNAATGVPGLTRHDAHQILGMFPPREEQDAIVSVLGKCDAAIQAASKESDTARQVKIGLMQQLFTKGLPGEHSEVAETTIGAVPKSWKLKRIQDVLSEPPFSGVSPESRPDPPGTPILNVACIYDGKCDTTKVTYVDVDDATAARCRARCGDFYVLRGNGNREYVGSGGWLVVEPDPPCIFSDKLIRLRFNDQVAEGFIPWLWQSHSFLRRLQSKAESGSGLWMMSKREIRRELFARPELHEQQAIVRALNKAEQALDACGRKIRVAQDLKTSLVQQLVTGRLRVTAGAT